jgi:predicted AAA+ superfamily ATPase
MKSRTFWVERIAGLWEQKPIVWLSGVRRVGKTSLCRQIAGGRYFNCDLPSVQRQLADPEAFFAQHNGDEPLLLDEVHRLADPALALKIAADEFPRLRILATGSSTLQATGKFRDSLTDRKRSMHLPPVLWRECLGAFDCPDLDRRLLHGGLPGVLLADSPDPEFFEDWMAGFYARDIQELFGVRNRSGFMALLRLVALRNGGLLNITDLAKESGLSRPTVASHLDAMEISHTVLRLPPFHGGGHREIIRRPRVYAFDTGLVAHVKGWTSIREDDRGPLWENLVLDELRAMRPHPAIHYWRDKSGHEVDFVIEQVKGRTDAIEAKISPDAFDPDSLRVFRSTYPHGTNYLLCPFVRTPYTIHKGGLAIEVSDTAAMASTGPRSKRLPPA